MNLGMETFIGSNAGVLLVLLVGGHMLADFLVQTETVAKGKETSAHALLKHGFETFLTHAALLLPYWSAGVLLGVVALAVAHTLADRVRHALEKGIAERALPGFLLDQLAHIAIAVFLWCLFVRSGVHEDSAVWFSRDVAAVTVKVLVVAAGYAFCWKGGTAVVRKLLARYPRVLPKTTEQAGRAEYAMGRTIGVLERFIIFTLVLFGQWGALGFVIAAKSIARFKELEDQSFADYYLMGTLTSVFCAIVVGIIVRAII
ncbi:DUF3307 domain-containing protein [bacterium]|jgi:hypothetical protein|nr:DUF3307 domain-containing protein [bacterium]